MDHRESLTKTNRERRIFLIVPSRVNIDILPTRGMWRSFTLTMAKMCYEYAVYIDCRRTFFELI